MADTHIWHAIDRLASMVTLLSAKAPLQVSTGHVGKKYFVHKHENGSETRIPIRPGKPTIKLPDNSRRRVDTITYDEIEGSSDDDDASESRSASGDDASGSSSASDDDTSEGDDIDTSGGGESGDESQ